ncbi:MAG: RbsD or FucU transport [Catenulispora sp.]|nr:RbsD or FucU transport [Catenulispora sp.]
MLRYPLIHPQLLAALAESGHGGKVLIGDGNFAHRTNVLPGTPMVYLNLSPGLVTADQVLAAILDACPIEAAAVMAPDDGSVAAAEHGFRALLGEEVPVARLGRGEFYAACREPGLAVAVATGDERHFANLLLTIGFNADPTVVGGE